MYFKALNIIDRKRFLCQILYNSFECNNFIDDFKYNTNFSLEVIVIEKNINEVSFVI